MHKKQTITTGKKKMKGIDYAKIERKVKKKQKLGDEYWEECRGGMKIFNDELINDESLINKEGGQSG